jgi:hypothetical protein
MKTESWNMISVWFTVIFDTIQSAEFNILHHSEWNLKLYLGWSISASQGLVLLTVVFWQNSWDLQNAAMNWSKGTCMRSTTINGCFFNWKNEESLCICQIYHHSELIKNWMSLSHQESDWLVMSNPCGYISVGSLVVLPKFDVFDWNQFWRNVEICQYDDVSM